MANNYDYGIIQGGTGSFGSLQWTDGTADNRKEIFDASKNLKEINSVSASAAIQGGAATFESVNTNGNIVVGGDLTVQGTTTTVDVEVIQSANGVIFEGATADANETTLKAVDPTADRTVQIANASGFLQPFAAASTTQISATPTELNVLDGITSTTAELNILDGVTSTAAEINLVDGATAGTIVNSKAVVYGSSGEVNATTLQIGGSSITATAAELNLIDGSSAGTVVNSKAVIYGSNGEVKGAEISGTFGVSGSYLEGEYIKLLGTKVTATAAELNYLDNSDLVSADIQKLADLTATAAELNIMDGVTSTTAELNILDGVTATAAELNYLDIASLGTAAASKALVADGSAEINANAITFTDLGTVTTVDINGGTIDNATLGATTPSSAKVTTLSGSGDADLKKLHCDDVDLDGGNIDGTIIGASSQAAAYFTQVSASSFVSASAFSVDGQASIKYDSSALDFGTGGAGAKLSTTMFSSSVELQGPSMEVSGAAKVGSLTLGGTAVTATAAEINDLAGNAVDASDFTKLSNVTATAAEINYLDNDDLTAADITKLAALDATAAEINILDGDTAASSVTVADGDRIVLNDGGTMKQVAMTDFETYFESALDTLPNVTTVGALNAGSITSGFGNVNIGTSTLNAGAMSASVGVSGSEGQFGDLKLAEQESGKYGNQHILFMSNGNVTSNGSFQMDDAGDFTVQAPKFKMEKLEVSSGGDRIELLSELSGNVAFSGSALILDSSTRVTSIKDEDNMASNSATALATQQSIKAYVDAQVTAQDLDFQADSGGALSIDLDSEVLSIVGTSNEIETAGSSNTITIGLPDDVTIGQDLTVTRNLSVNGNATLGDAAGDDITFNGSLASNLAVKTNDAYTIGSSSKKLAAIYANNVYTGDFHMKNERGDWTLFEESDHIRIRNNSTGQEFKLDMTPLAE